MSRRILVRLPNWLGDMVMSSAFMAELQEREPEAQIEVIAKKGLVPIAERLPGVDRVHSFSKNTHKGILGLIRYGKSLKGAKAADLFFCLPNSFSSAWMARFSGAIDRIGYAGEGRSWLLSQAYSKPEGLHRAREYQHLLEVFYDSRIKPRSLLLNTSGFPPLPSSLTQKPYLVLNLNSVAQSRRMPIARAAQLVVFLHQSIKQQLVLVGGPNESPYVEAVVKEAGKLVKVLNLAGQTSLPELMAVLAGAQAVVSTDSGPAHLSHALGTPLLVFFGAGNEHNTGPFSPYQQEVLRVKGLTCAPCLKNLCKFGEPKCLNQLEDASILQALQKLLP